MRERSAVDARRQREPAWGRPGFWYVPRRMRRGTRIGSVVAAAAALAVAGCDGDERQDANEPSGTYTVEVVEASFPEEQSLAAPTEMEITVRNADTKPVPVVAVTVDSFSKDSEQPDLADPSRPIWVVDDEPEGGVSAYTDTWSLGELAPGESRTFRWALTPVEAGTHTVNYRVAAGLDGEAKAQLPDGGVPEGSFEVVIDEEPAQARVDPRTGEVERVDPDEG